MTKQEFTRRSMHRPYKSKTVAQLLQENGCRIDVAQQARLYALWLNQHERPICYLYPKNKATDAAEAGEVLRLSLRRSIYIVEVDPKNFLGRYQP